MRGSKKVLFLGQKMEVLRRGIAARMVLENLTKKKKKKKSCKSSFALTVL